MCYCLTPTLHLNLALTGDGAFLFSLKKNHSGWFIRVLNYGDTENVLINHLLHVIPMSYPCHYTNLCPHKPHKHAPPPTHTHTQTYGRQWEISQRCLLMILFYVESVMWEVQAHMAMKRHVFIYSKKWTGRVSNRPLMQKRIRLAEACNKRWQRW